MLVQDRNGYTVCVNIPESTVTLSLDPGKAINGAYAYQFGNTSPAISVGHCRTILHMAQRQSLLKMAMKLSAVKAT